MKVLSVVGARPQFIKAAPVSKALIRNGISEFLVHTGQHYDYGMSQTFFDELGLPNPDINLEVGSGPHGWQTAQMLTALEAVMQEQRPEWVLIYGDTNSTLAGALSACKLQIPLAHVEAGLRSFNREMPEEHNRVLADHCADVLFCPTQTAVKNLAREGITDRVYLVGDTMYDAVLQFTEIAQLRSSIMTELGLRPKEFLLVTIHRPYNTDKLENLDNILAALLKTDETVVFPVQPRTRLKLQELKRYCTLDQTSRVKVIDPVGYWEMLVLQEKARLVLTDSVGMQKEDYFLRTPCLTLRPETDWVEAVQAGWNVLVGADPEKLLEATNYQGWPSHVPDLFGDGRAAKHTVRLLSQ
jgi:UDP-GlcNAc3NAcA epimerase